MPPSQADHFPVDPAPVDYAAVFAEQPTAYLMMTPDLVIIDANASYLRLLGRTREELVGRPVFDAFPPTPDALDASGANPLQLSFERARDTGRPDQMPLFHYDVLDQLTGRPAHRVWSLVSAPVLDAAGTTQLILQRVEDVTEYVAALERLDERGQGLDRMQGLEADLYTRAQELRAALGAQEVATTRLAGLATAALRLAAVTSLEEMTETVAGAGLAAFGADGGAIAVRDDDQNVVHVTVTASIEAPTLLRYARLPRSSRMPVAWVARTGEPLVFRSAAECQAWSPEMAQVQAATGRSAWVVLPLRVGDRLVGALAAAWTEEHSFAPDELALLESFAAQYAQALDRLQVQISERRVAEANRQLSETWQRSLLTEPPPLDHLDVAVRYRPASADSQVGGDWYDAFGTGDGALTVVIGDVTGHDRTAAAAMAQIRNVLRGVAQTLVQPPATVLTTLDGALANLRVQALATAVLAQVRQDADQAAAGTSTVTWSNAGHPPPLLLLPDGTATVLARRPDLLLGVDPTAARTDHELLLPAGATFLLYTDGLVESPGHDLDEGTERLRATAAALARLPVEQLCDELLDRLAPAPADDVALLALRCAPAR